MATASGDPMAGDDFFDDRLEWDMTGVTGWPEKRVYRGREEIVADGDDYVVVMNSLVGRGAASGAPLDLRWGSVAWFRDRKLIRSVGFAHRREALVET